MTDTVRIRLDVHCRDQAHAAGVIENLSRVALAYGLDGAVAALLVVPTSGDEEFAVVEDLEDDDREED